MYNFILDPPSTLQNFQCVANLQKKMVVAERKEAEATTRHKIEVGLAVRQAAIELLAENFRQ